MKFMNKKRFGAIVMAGAMALSLTVPAFAEGNTTTIEGTYEEIPISVVVPESGTAQINPYGLPVDVNKSDGTKAQLTDQQITTQPLSLKNQGTVPLDVSASLKVVPKGDLIIKKAALNTEKGKETNVTLEVAGLNDNALKVATDDATLEDKLIDKFTNDATWTGLAADSKLAAEDAAKGAAANAIVAAKTADNKSMATLGAVTTESDGSIKYGAKSIALFRLTGKLNASPNDGAAAPNTKDTPWTAADGFTATIVFSFKPAAKTTVNVTVTGTATVAPPTTIKGYEGDTITFTFEAAAGKTCTGAVTGMDGSAPTVTITETPSGSGKYTGSFTMPADDSTPNIALAITIPT